MSSATFRAHDLLIAIKKFLKVADDNLFKVRVAVIEKEIRTTKRGPFWNRRLPEYHEAIQATSGNFDIMSAKLRVKDSVELIKDFMQLVEAADPDEMITVTHEHAPILKYLEK